MAKSKYKKALRYSKKLTKKSKIREARKAEMTERERKEEQWPKKDPKQRASE